MSLTAFVDVAIGLSLMYLGASLYVTIVNEFIAQTLRLRGRQLAKNLKALIDDPGLKEKLAKNPALEPFLGGTRPRGSYIDPGVLARLLIGTVRNAPNTVATMEEIVQAIESLPDSAVKTQLSALAQSASDSVDKLVESVGQWADRSLTALGEVYKKRVQIISFGIGLVTAVAFNLDTLTIVGHLYRDKEARDAVVAVAVELADSTRKEAFERCLQLPPAERAKTAACAPIMGLVDSVRGRNETLGQLPILWRSWNEALKTAISVSSAGWLGHWIGWLLTAIAVSLGAPFWFDLLNRLVNVRHGMRRPEAEGSR